jgi:hypothetical protein
VGGRLPVSIRDAVARSMPVLEENSRSDHPCARRSFFICRPKCVSALFPSLPAMQIMFPHRFTICHRVLQIGHTFRRRHGVLTDPHGSAGGTHQSSSKGKGHE